jgi:MFS family permease
MIVPRVNLTLDLICREYLADQSTRNPTFQFAPVNPAEENPQCRIPQIQALTTAFLLYINLISSILAAITSPKLGALSDRYGRTSLLMMTICGALVGEVITILVANYPDTVHYSWMLGGAAVDGLSGSFIAGWAMTHSYATDCTPPAKRAVSFGYFHACLFAGIALGPVIAAYMVKLTGSLISIFYFVLGCHSLFFLCVVFLVPESLTKKRQLAARESYAFEQRARAGSSSLLSIVKSSNIFSTLKILYPTGEGSFQVRTNLLLLSAVDGIVFGIAMSAASVVILYSEYQFEWTNYETNLFLSISNSCRVAALVVVLPALNYIFRTRYKNKMRRESGIKMVERNSGSDNFDLWLIRFSMLIEIAGYGGYASVRKGGLFILSGTLASFGGIGSPTLQAALTKHVSHDRTGQLLGATGLLHALARVVCPPFFSYIYINTVHSFPQMVFIVLAGCFGLAFIFSCFVKPHGTFPVSFPITPFKMSRNSNAPSFSLS